jgi:tRNA 2-selenouridine synthase
MRHNLIHHPFDLGVLDWGSYALVIDVRSPREYALDHLPKAINLPLVTDAEHAELLLLARQDPQWVSAFGEHRAKPRLPSFADKVAAQVPVGEPVLVYSHRGGWRTRLAAQALHARGLHVDWLGGGWLGYRQWIERGLRVLSHHCEFRVLHAVDGRSVRPLLRSLRLRGQQVVDLEALSNTPSTQRQFESDLVEELRCFIPEKPVWLASPEQSMARACRELPTPLLQALCEARRVVVEVADSTAARARLLRGLLGDAPGDD